MFPMIKTVMTRCFDSPAAIEVCDGLDNDCDNNPDDFDDFVEDALEWYADADGDGFGTGAPMTACIQPVANAVLQSGDCLDTEASIHPAAVEGCGDSLDNDCDGLIDSLDTDAQSVLWYEDLDGDMFGNPESPLSVF